jgi:hypothetical protein
LIFWARASLCSPGCPGTHFVDQAGLELRNLPASASWVLGLKGCATTPRIVLFCFVFGVSYVSRLPLVLTLGYITRLDFKCWGICWSFLKDLWHWCFVIAVTVSSSKSASHERKSTLTPTQRESIPAKSPVPGVDPVVSHSPFDPHHRSSAAGEVYRSHLPTHLDPAMPFHRALDPGKPNI